MACRNKKRRAGASKHCSGVAEHTSVDALVSSANIELQRAMMTSQNWLKTHRPALLEQFINMLSENDAIAIFLCEVGTHSAHLQNKERQEFKHLIYEAFEEAGASEHGRPKIFWEENSTTIAAFRAEVTVQPLQTPTKMTRVHDWRQIDPFLITSAAEHGPYQVLVYNNHQPASQLRPFPANMRIHLARAILRHAIKFFSENPECIGWIQLGDANLSQGTWSGATREERQHMSYYEALQFHEGSGKNMAIFLQEQASQISVCNNL